MKTIGMLGGMSWESTASYYRALNEGVKARLGGLHSAKLCLVSVDFAEIEALQRTGDWDSAGALLAEAARQVERGGADFLLICTNTMHKVVASIEAPLSIPLIHIADATAQRLKEDGVTRVGLLGTRFTMAEDFYKGRLEERFGIEVLVPDTPTQERLSSIIYDELCLGVIEDASRRVYLEAIAELARRGAQGVILGCTEIALLVQQPHTDTQLYDTTALHAHAAIEAALAE
ncbi:MAG: amino acid racemase [Gammaproteobacteria bacterium]|jgi:aspartate racemase|nr:amino acid racemase [Gammaproteobacteria bacterium]